MMTVNHNRLILAAAMIIHTLAAAAQYTVTGGSASPLLALDDTPNKLQVWLVYGTGNVAIQYSSSSSTHVWKSYRNKAIEAETITDNISQAGTTSTLRGIKDGYGYFVEEEGQLSKYVWIIDYSLHPFSISSLGIMENDDPCNELWLDGEISSPPLTYYTPVGLQRELKRTFEASWNTMEWSSADRKFIPRNTVKTIEGNPFDLPITPPLSDTEITLRGDMFARHFNVEQSRTTDTWQAVAVEAHIDSTVTAFAGTNIVEGKSSGYSAPVYIQFSPLCNEPAVNWYKWTIFHSTRNEIIREATVRDMDYTFNESGTYTITLEVSDRTRKCARKDSVTITISESYIHVPNAFSPGVSPGVNDIFKVAYKSLVTFNGWIFNRWGTELFRWSDPAQGWDGKKNGKYLPPGVYYYVIEAKGSDGIKYNKKGHINIIRSKDVHDQITEQ
jgi:gliding motility-associated-like protein